MTINLQISDTAYRRLLAGHGRIQGTIGLVSPTEGNFNEHARQHPRRARSTSSCVTEEPR